MIDMEALTASNVKASADWRRQIARRHPDDADRNLKAAAMLDSILTDLKRLEGTSLHRRAAAAAKGDGETFDRVLLILARQVGFVYFPKTGEVFLRDALDRVAY